MTMTRKLLDTEYIWGSITSVTPNKQNRRS